MVGPSFRFIHPKWAIVTGGIGTRHKDGKPRGASIAIRIDTIKPTKATKALVTHR